MRQQEIVGRALARIGNSTHP